MFRLTKGLAVVLSLLLCAALCAPLFAEEGKIEEGMKQGEFAMLLIKELGAQGQLPPAATVQDAFNFLQKIGVVPSKGWDEKGTVDSKFLADLLGMKDKDAAFLTFDELLAKLKERIAQILWSLGIRSVAPQTISPAGA